MIRRPFPGEAVDEIPRLPFPSGPYDCCNKDQPPTGPTTPTLFYLDLTGYGETLQPGYLKIYSDSSWEKYGGIDTVNGTAYVSTVREWTARCLITPCHRPVCRI